MIPIALFVHRRPFLTSQVVRALAKNAEAQDTDLYIFSDGASDEDKILVGEVRSYLYKIEGFRSVHVYEAMRNLGLTKSIIHGVTTMLQKFDRVIVLEDDLLPSKFFLDYMNKALMMYENDDNVASVHAFQYRLRKPVPETFFLLGADCWGWGTWRRAWKYFNPHADELLGEIKKLKGAKYEFDYDGNYPMTRMLERVAKDKLDAWAILWRASAYLRGMLTLYPAQSLIQHYGYYLSTHNFTEKDRRDFATELSGSPVRLLNQPAVESIEGRAAMVDFFKSIRPPIHKRFAKNLLSRFI